MYDVTLLFKALKAFQTKIKNKKKFQSPFSCPWIRIRIRIANLDPDPDPGTPLNPDPIRIRIHSSAYSQVKKSSLKNLNTVPSAK